MGRAGGRASRAGGALRSFRGRGLSWGLLRPRGKEGALPSGGRAMALESQRSGGLLAEGERRCGPGGAGGWRHGRVLRSRVGEPYQTFPRALPTSAAPASALHPPASGASPLLRIASRCLAPWRRPRCRQVCDGGHQRGVPAQPGGERARQARQGRPRRPRAAGAAHAGRQQVCCGADVSGWRTSGGRGGAIVWREARPAALWCWVPVAVAARGRAELQMGAACRAGRVFRACKSFLACRASA